jgi:PAS domain S-box-containing protein
MTTSRHSQSLPTTPILALLETQRHVLGQIAAEVPLTEVLEGLARAMEAHYAGQSHVSILLLDETGKYLRLAAAPSLPECYSQAIDGLAIGPAAGPCGAAALDGKPVYASDIATDPLWADCRKLALPHGLMACWAMPVHDTDHQVLGTLAMYRREPLAPALQDVEAMALAAQTVALAIERQKHRHTFRAREAWHRQIINSATDFAIISTDRKGIITSWNEGAHSVLGWTEKEMVGQGIHRFFTPEDVDCGRPEAEMETALRNGHATDERWHLKANGERFWASGQLAALKDDAGMVIGFVKIMRDQTSQKRLELELEQAAVILESEVDKRTRERDRIWRNSLDLLLAIDPDGVLRAVNPAWTRLLGYEPNELVNRHFEPFVHPDDIGATLNALAEAVQGPLERLEIRMRHKNGDYRWFAWRAAPEEGMVYANGRDITIEKRQAELLLRANEARLYLALEAGEMGAWEWNLQSNSILRLHGMTEARDAPAPKDLALLPIKNYLERYVHPDDRAILSASMGGTPVEGASHRVEYRVLWPDGSIHWIEIRGQTLAEATGAPLKVVGVSIDITKRKRAEQDLKFLAQASAELASLVDPQSTLDRLAFLAVPFFADWCAIDLLQEDGSLKRVAVAHADARKVQLAHEFHRRFPPDPNMAHGTWSVIRSGRAQMVSEVTNDLLEQAISDPVRLKIMKELGVRSYIAVPLSTHGRTLGAITFFAAESGRLYQAEDLALAEDLARRAAVALENADLYRTVRQSDHAKDIFLATLSHELRNPLAAIVSGLSVARLAIDDRERVVKYLGLMERQAGQLARLVDDLMDVSRISTGKIELKKELGSLTNILKNAIETSRPQIEAGKHKLTVMLPDEPAMLHADPTRLAQVFSNLLTNAAKYTNQGGDILVALECMPGEFVVRVRDTGIGIEPVMLKSVFKMFTQVTHPIERSQGGLGIGLSLVDGLVKMHGGSVEAFSKGAGHGSEFVVRLPRLKEEHAAPAPAQGTPPQLRLIENPAQPKRVLVVDDSVDAATTVAEILRMLGNEVVTVHDGLDAVTTAVSMQPDVIILDIGLPGIDGYEAARRIRAQEGERRRTVLIALTGWGQEDDRRRAYAAGFDQHWVKPVGMEQLKQISLLG